MDRMNRLEDKIDNLTEKCERIAIETAANTASLKEHMAQTVEVRKQTDLLRGMIDYNKTETNTRISALETFKSNLLAIFRTLCYVGTVIYALDKLGVFSFFINLVLSIKQIK